MFTVIPDGPRGRDNYYQLLAISSGHVQKFRGIDYRITTELMEETDSLIQRVSDLITVDEGYRSRDQNESIRRWQFSGSMAPIVAM